MQTLCKFTFRLNAFLLCLLALAATPAVLADEHAELQLTTVVVTADYRQSGELQTPASVTVLGTDTLETAGEQHLEDVLGLVPNLNWSGGTSRPRYLQIRGIGERSQYQGAPNPSVGFIVDDIDFSGIGMLATLFDLEQVEVLRGPQGTRYGANALAGLINLRSQSPTDVFSGRYSLDAGGDGAYAAGVVLSGPLGRAANAATARLAVHQYRSDGFRDNVFLNRHDTNKKDETTIRFKLHKELTEQLQLEFTALGIDIDNGYDAFAIDNSLTTLSDKPGADTQVSKAAAIKLTWAGNDNYEFVSISSFADTDIEFSFDGDWGNDRDWAPFDPYDFYSETFRARRTASQEFRIISQPGAEIFAGRSAWLAGVYALRLKERNSNQDFFNGALFTELDSDYSATSSAVFGQLDTALGENTTLTSGLRLEHRSSRYRDSAGSDFSPSETMLGGQLVLNRSVGENMNAYAGVSRGYKAGGFNIGARIPDERRQFGAEYLWNFEAGLKGLWPEHGLRANFGVFYMLRKDQQVSTSFQDDPADPLSFTFYNDNAAAGRNLGFEADFSWTVNESWRLFSTLGLLDTRFDDFVTATRSANGRDQAHAPSYTFSIGAQYQNARGFYSRLDVSGKDAFYFSDSHDQRSRSYELVNVRLGWASSNWDIYTWARNIFDQNYAVRGFYFGNEPPDYPEKLYTRQGDPQVAGMGIDYRF